MSIYTIFHYFPLISAIVTLCLALFILLRNPKRRLHQLFFWNGLAFVNWFVASFMMMQMSSDAEILAWDRIVYASIVFAPILVYHFGLVFTGRQNQPRCLWRRRYGYVLAFVFLLLSRTDNFVSGVYHWRWGVHSIAQFWHHIFLIYLLIYILWFAQDIWHYYHNVDNNIRRSQAGYVGFAFLLLVVLGSTAFLPAYGISVYPLAYLSGLLFSALVAWSIVKYRFMGIKFALRRSLSMFVSLVIVLLLFAWWQQSVGRLAASWQVGSYWLYGVGVLLLAIVFQSLRQLTQAILDQWFFHGAKKYEAVWQRVQQGRLDQLDLSAVIKYLVVELNHLYAWRGLDIMIRDQQGSGYQLAYSTISKDRFDWTDLQVLASALQSSKKILSCSEMIVAQSDRPQGERAMFLDILKHYNYDIVMPIYDANTLVGAVFGQAPRRILRGEDYRLLQKLMNRASLAIGNVLLYQQALARVGDAQKVWRPELDYHVDN
ncbi:MAG: histidine kinase N-terminal 7TM domain-containing protein [Candidatus Komeilibacteria bacterium]